MEKFVLGFPRIGTDRELKKSLEGYWNGNLSLPELRNTTNKIKLHSWKTQKDAGLSLISTGDFSFYDHVLDISFVLGLIPDRYEANLNEMELYFQMARGSVQKGIPAMEMTKWFDTNYHYIVPEFTPSTKIKLTKWTIQDDTRQAWAMGYRTKPVLIGPITFLSLSKEFAGVDKWSYLPEIIHAYQKIISDLSNYCEFIQIDEPILCLDMLPAAKEYFITSFKKLKKAASESKLILASYFGRLGDNLDIALKTGCDVLHIDLVRGGEDLEPILKNLPKEMSLSAGMVDGRNIWKNDYSRSLFILNHIANHIGYDRLMIASSCSLLHSPLDLTLENKLDPEIKKWMSFAKQKCGEISALQGFLAGKELPGLLAENEKAIESRRNSGQAYNKKIRNRVASVTPDMLERKSNYKKRKEKQMRRLQLPLLPTTTIGSFPQTEEIRKERLEYKKGVITAAAYEGFIKNEIEKIIRKQEELGLDVLVHGEPERNDMVEYFGQQLKGFCFTENGWVQSYGSRCVKPPVIYGDIERTRPMTVKWITYAQSLTDRPVKGMLTGPITILCWSFVRNDLPRNEVCKQIALAIRDEVADLEAAGTKIIQIDEAALREGLPLRKQDKKHYLRWAVDSFRLASSVASDEIQIHTHMCYSEFNEIVKWIAQMDADVISIESSRSKMELLEAFQTYKYPSEIGPGVYDIHCPRIPSVEEISALIQIAMDVIPVERLWVNPDCGLKTRKWEEVIPSLQNMIQAVINIRKV